ncbi:unnamed protein product [Ixodes pacificus]
MDPYRKLPVQQVRRQGSERYLDRASKILSAESKGCFDARATRAVCTRQPTTVADRPVGYDTAALADNPPNGASRAGQLFRYGGRLDRTIENSITSAPRSSQRQICFYIIRGQFRSSVPPWYLIVFLTNKAKMSRCHVAGQYERAIACSFHGDGGVSEASSGGAATPAK